LFKSEQRLYLRELNDTLTESVHLFVKRELLQGDRLTKWILTNCKALKTFLFMNFPRQGVQFENQNMPPDLFPRLEELHIFDNLNSEFFK
jgi:hypothetical protein